MHKLAKGLKKKKKSKKGKKGEEEEFDPEELERYRRERAEAQQKAEAETGGEGEETSGGSGGGGAAAGSDEWRKFQALTAGVDSILKKTQSELDRIKSTSFYQRKPPVEEKPEEEAKPEEPVKKFIGFDASGNPIEASVESEQVEKPLVNEDGFVQIPDDDEEVISAVVDDDIFDTTYIDVLQNIDVQLAYIPESPTEAELGDDPFDTTSADKVLKTVDKKGNKLVSLGNAVEVLAGRIDYKSKCKITKGNRRARTQEDLWLDDYEAEEPPPPGSETTLLEVEKTLLDDDSDLPDIELPPIDLDNIIAILPKPVTPINTELLREDDQLDITEFESFNPKTILEEIPDLDDAEFDLNDKEAEDEPIDLEENEDPFGTKEPQTLDFQTEIIEANFEVATFVDEEDPFDTAFADNILPGKTELKFIEKELEEFTVDEVTKDSASVKLLNLQKQAEAHLTAPVNKDLLGGSATDLSKLADTPIKPLEEIIYVDPFDTSAVQDLPPGQTELKVLEKELLGDRKPDSLEDDDFDPRQDERKASRPEILQLAAPKIVAFELPTPSQRPDLLKTTEEEKSLPSKPLTPYYSQKSIDETISAGEESIAVPTNHQDQIEEKQDPFDTSFVANKVPPSKTELKIIESELLTQEPTKLTQSLSDQDFNPRTEQTTNRRQSDFNVSSLKSRPNNRIDEKIQKIIEESQRKNPLPRQESLLDAEVNVDAKPLTPQALEEEEISYTDPFDTSIATNILPGKAELKILEDELKQLPEQQIRPTINPIANIIYKVEEEVEDFDPRAEESKDYLSLEGQDPGVKALTPVSSQDFNIPGEDVDPFDTSFANLGPGKTELKLLESELLID